MRKQRQIVVIAHNLRSCHNVGSLLRTAEGLGVAQVLCTGYTPYPLQKDDPRLPHEAQKLHKQISKTALGAEDTQSWEHAEDIFAVIDRFRQEDYVICALEQTPSSIALPTFATPDKLVLIIGREVEGLEPAVLEACDIHLEIPMFGQKESFNVVQAAAMALYHCTFS